MSVAPEVTAGGQATAYQLRNCARWHERQAHRAPQRAKHHYATATSLREQANTIVRATSNSVNAPR